MHCYRLLGSFSEAEDAVQETMLRAWRHVNTFTEQGPQSLRAWLYKIATNSSLDLLKKRSPRRLPTAATPQWDPHRPIAKRETEALWLEPFPTSWLAEATENPEARYSRQESVSLAFLTVLQSFTDPTSPLGANLDAMVAAIRQVLDAARVRNLPVIFTSVAYE